MIERCPNLGGMYKRQYHPIPLEESVDLQPCKQSILFSLLLDQGGEEEILPESRQSFEVATV